VTDVAIDAQLMHCKGTDKERLSALQVALQCGTNCGSCVPQLQRMVRASAPTLSPTA
jgi:assimilatory nitrate reductase catalytic subunit